MTKSYNDPFEHVDFNAIIDGTKENGVSSGLVVSERGAGQNMSVDVAPGVVTINEVSYTEASTVNVVISAADVTHSRKDIIIYDVATTNPAVVAGTPAAEPIPPDITSGDILLAVVNVAANETTIANTDIEDGRVNVNPQLVYEPSSAIFHANDTLRTRYPASWAKMKEIQVTMGRAEYLRVVFTIQGSGGGFSTYQARVYRNGTYIRGYETGADAWGTATEFEFFVPSENGDNIQIYGYGTGNPSYSLQITNFRILGAITLARSSMSAVSNDP